MLVELPPQEMMSLNMRIKIQVSLLVSFYIQYYYLYILRFGHFTCSVIRNGFLSFEYSHQQVPVEPQHCIGDSDPSASYRGTNSPIMLHTIKNTINRYFIYEILYLIFIITFYTLASKGCFKQWTATHTQHHESCAFLVNEGARVHDWISTEPELVR